MRGADTRRWALAAVLALGGCERDGESRSEGGPEAPRTSEGSAEGADEAGASESASMVGVLVPASEVVLVASGFARLQRLDVQVGDHVGDGDVVAEMDVRGDKSELASATAAWKASKAELERLELELEQARAARKDVEQLEDFISRAELREQRFAEKLAAARKRSAGASLSQQRSKMEEASARIAEAELRAPFDGVISKRYVDPGATLSTGEPVVQLISDSRLVRFAVPEGRADALRLGATVLVRFEEEDGSEPLEVSGTVSTIAPEIDAGTRLILAEAELRLSAEQREALRVGKVGRVRFAP